MSRIFRVVCFTLPVVVSCLIPPTLHAAAPNAITYQGSIKQNGTPVNGTYTIELRLTNSDGSQLYWTTAPQSVTVQEGLYRMEIAPTGIDWSSVNPYIETKVNGTLFLPREKMNSTPFAFIANELSTCAVARGNLDVKGVAGVEGNFAVGASTALATAKVLIKSPSVGNNTLLQFSNSGSTSNWKMNYTDADGSLSFTPSSNTYLVKFNNDVSIQNNLGIGTAAFSNAKLYIRSPDSSDNTLIQLGSRTNNGYWKFNYNGADGSLKLFSNSTDDYPLKLISKVAIATSTAPTESLEVAGNVKLTGMVKSEQNKPAFFVSVIQDACGASHPYLGCPTGYQQSGTWYVGPGFCSGLQYGHGYENGDVSWGWMGMCVAQ